jgi:amino acid adenylation domain-containing protein
VAYIADNGSRLSLVRAVFNKNSHEDTELELHLQQLVDVEHLNITGSDFVLHYQIAGKRNTVTKDKDKTIASILTQELLQPLILSVALFSEQKTADITLYLRQDHGPKAAARHLLDLAIAYLRPQIDFAKTKKSQLVTAFPTLQETPDAEFPRFLHSILAESALLYPNNIAIDEVTGRSALLPSSVERRILTYSELNNKVSVFADQIEQVLQRLDWPDFKDSQKMIPIFLPNSTELNICMNAISKAGHCFCILQTDAPEERLRNLLDDLNCNGILGVGINPWADTDFGQQIIWIDFLKPFACLSEGRSVLPTNAAPLTRRRQNSQDDLAYIVYTSGSTGSPKGVITSHRNAMAYLRACDSGPGRLPIGPGLRWMIMSAPTFDIMLMDNFMPLLKGGTVCIAARQLLLSNPESIVHELRATATFTVSSLAMLLRPERLPTLNTIIVGGEPIGQRIVDNFAQKPGEKEKEPRRRLIEIYGPTETTVGVTNHICHTDSRPSVLGAPLPGTRLVVLDETGSAHDGHLALAPLGVAGELAIGGPQLSPGYLNRPRETAQSFVHDTELGRLYKTGDRVRIVWTEDGEPMIDYIGRITSDQVKLNGRRVELPEIENVLSRGELAAQVAVLIFKSRLVAFVMPWEGFVKEDEAVIEAQCRANAERFLPTWMQPRHYRIMDRLPYTVSGKVDRRALEAIIAMEEELSTTWTTAVLPGQNSIHDARTVDSSLQSGNAPYEITNGRQHDMPRNGAAPLQLSHEGANGHHPATPADNDIASVVYEALYETLGFHVQGVTSLADVGIDSLRALVFLQNLEEREITQVDIQDVLSAPTVDSLIRMIDDRRSNGVETGNITNGIGTHDANNKDTHNIVVTTTTTVNNTLSPFVDGIDVSKIAADDADEIFDLSVAAKLRHFDYHCRALALAALGLESTQVEQVLPATNVQTRFLALAIDPEYFDKTRLIGRPYITHFPYALPSDIDPARFQRAVDAVLPRYDCFRAVFTPTVHSLTPFAQVILSFLAARIPKVEIVCSDADADSPDSLWRETINGAQLAAEAAMSIDRPGITLSWVWSQSRARCVFIMSLFHAIYDGTQLGYMFDAILAEYEQPGCQPSLDLLPMRRAVELNLSYDWVSTVVFWAGRFGGVPGSRLGSQRPNPKALLLGSKTGCEMTHMRSLSVKASMTMQQLSQAAVAMSNSMLTVVEAAWASVLAQTFPEKQRLKPLDVQFGTVLNGRRNQDSLRCMAPMLAALPLRLVVDHHDSTHRRITNREVCALLAAQRSEAQPYLQMPCPTLMHARMGMDRFDTVMLVQALQPASSRQTLRQLPGFNFDENLMAPFKETDIGFPMTMELWPGSLRWDEKMLIRCAYSTARHAFLNREWVLAALSALDEAIVRITSEPDAAFYVG